MVLDDNVEPSIPLDWDATFWRYYSIVNGKPVQNESKIWATGFYKGGYVAEEIQLYNLNGSQDNNDGEISLTGLNLKPNESVAVFTFTIESGSEILNQSVVSGVGIEADGLVLVKDNVTNPYIINYGSDSLFVRLVGEIPEGKEVKNSIVIGNYIYFIKVIHPGEIVEVPSSVTGVETKSAMIDYVSGQEGTLAGWDNEIINIFDIYFT